MAMLSQVSKEWASRPADQRFVSLLEMQAQMKQFRANSRERVIPSNSLRAVPCTDHEGLQVVGPNGGAVDLTNWSFGQLAQRAEAPAGYLRTLPAELAADCINDGLRRRDIADIGVLLTRQNPDVIESSTARGLIIDGATGRPADEAKSIITLGAVTGPNYGRVWNSTIVDALINRFGDGITGDFRVPGEFGKHVDVTRANTTLYASDRDMFVFLCDERNRIEVKNRRDGQPGSLARGFIVGNSQVGAGTLWIATMLFDFVCQNRMIWGAENFQEFRVRHTSSAPQRWIHEVAPAIEAYANASAVGITRAIEHAQAARLDNLDQFLAARFTKSEISGLRAAHAAEEGRPVETLWDVATGATAYARGMQWQDARVDMERKAGKLLALAA